MKKFLLFVFLFMSLNVYSDVEYISKNRLWEYESRYTDKYFKLSQDSAQKIISDKTDIVITSILSKDFIKLSEFIHPMKGCRFSPHPWINKEKKMNSNNEIIVEADRVIFPKEVKSFFYDTSLHYWGNGLDIGLNSAINLTNEEYYYSFLKLTNKSSEATKKIEYPIASIGYNKTVNDSCLLSNWFEVYPDAIMIEYNFVNKYSLRIFYEEFNNNWNIVGIVTVCDENLLVAASGDYCYSKFSSMSSEDAFKIINKTSDEVIRAIVNRDFKKWAGYVYPEKGLQFSIEHYPEAVTNVFFYKDIIPTEKRKIELPPYDSLEEKLCENLKNFDVIHSPIITYNRTLVGDPRRRNNWWLKFENLILVEYLFPYSIVGSNSKQCQSLVLLFEQEKDGKWYNVALIHEILRKE